MVDLSTWDDGSWVTTFGEGELQELVVESSILHVNVSVLTGEPCGKS